MVASVLQINSHCYLKGVVLLQTLETMVSEDYMLAVIRSLVATKTSFDLENLLFYFKDIAVDVNVTLAQVYKFWFTTGGFPAIKVSSTVSNIELRQLSELPWPLRLSSYQPLPRFLFAKTITLAPRDGPVLINLNFTSFFRVNYDPVTWTSIFSLMDDHPALFSTLGRAQLVTDFCYFYARGDVDSGLEIREIVVDMVYRNSELFELCDWHLLWCHSTMPSSLGQLLQQVALRAFSLFDTNTAFGCRTGLAARDLNAICSRVFTMTCI
uniref:Peptidase_M1 domain-containing protein n=1 Tax=Angiostrongylus cantonensis TaxID=6313 RepID=A0A0K0CX83_ANGCA